MSRYLAAVLLVLLTACGGLPDVSVSLAEAIHKRVGQTRQEVDAQEQAYQQFQKSAQYGALARYAEKESWARKFANARKILDSAETLYQTTITPILERDDEKELQVLNENLKKISPLTTSARGMSLGWKERSDFITQSREQAPALIRGANADLQKQKGQNQAIGKIAAQTAREFPARKDDIGKLLQPLAALVKQSEAANEAIRGESGKVGSDDADYALIGDNHQILSENATRFEESGAEVSAKLAELSRSYSKTLIDMQATYAVIIRRYSWDDSRNSPTVHHYDYRPRQVDLDTYNHLTSNTAAGLGQWQAGWFGSGLKLYRHIDPKRWDTLRIDPRESWSNRNDNAAEYWVEDDKVNYFHKYLAVENGETSETGLVAVSAALFLANVDNLGMDVEAKPYGSFEDEKLAHAAPPGMAYVGNPRYGHWASDGRGGSVWTWVGPYLIYRSLFGTPYYYGRNTWSTWSGGYRGSRPYYGGTAAAPLYGTRSKTTQTSPRYQNSSFGRTGGFRRVSASVRGAGPGGRGGGFGGSGK